MKLPCTLMRGGSSKAVILREEDLPPSGPARDDLILRIFGSPDRRQIDGLGGADPLTSKLAIVGVPTLAGTDIDYTFAQVGIERPYVDYGGYCGNVLAAVAAFAVNEKYVKAGASVTQVRVHVTNTSRVVLASVPVAEGMAAEEGHTEIAGVPGTGAGIMLDFGNTIGSVTGRILPTGNPLDYISVPNIGRVEFSLVDAGNPMIFVSLDHLGLSPTDGPDEIDGRADLIEKAERIRLHISREFGLVAADGSVSENIPLLAAVGPAAAYTAYSSRLPIPSADADFISREFFAGRLHKAYGVGETVSTAAAAVLPGTLVHRICAQPSSSSRMVRIGHPSGVIRAAVGVERNSIVSIEIERTARLLMKGWAFA